MKKLFSLILVLALALTACAALAEGNATPADFAGLTMDANVFSYNAENNTINATIRAFELHEADEIENLKVDDKMTISGSTWIVTAIDEDGIIHVVEESAPAEGEMEVVPFKTDDGKYYLEEYAKAVKLDVATLDFELADGFKFIDGIDPETYDSLDTPVEKTKDDFVAAITGGESYFDIDNTTLTFDEEGKVIELFRDFVP